MPSYDCALSVADQIMPAMNTTMWLVFKAEDPDTALKAIKKGLDRTVVQLPFLSASNGPTYEEFENQGFDLHKFPANVYSPGLLASMASDVKPVLIMSFIKIQGGLIVLFAPQHAIVDGGGRELLIKLWSSNTRGVPDPTLKVDPKEPLDRSERLKQIVRNATTDCGESGVTQKPLLSSLGTEAPASTQPSETPPTTAKLFQFSVRRLEALRQALRRKTKGDFSLNTLVTSLIWVTWTSNYIRKQHAANSDFKAPQQYSELIMAINARSVLAKGSFLEKDSWLGNLASAILPAPYLSFDGANDDFFDLVVGDPVQRLLCRKTIPAVIEMITTGLANTTASRVAGMWATLLESASNPTFDWTTARANLAVSSGRNLVHTNWGSLDLLQDFGPVVGRPKAARVMGVGAPPGICITLPRHRSKECGEELLDRYDVCFCLQADELEDFEQDGLIKAISRN
ncbi:putative Transferase family-domain-containing protein [Seiridium cardinale]|uniref:Transferase family-domain-containing protein n=1 Tax=Seiridium cardinale TaxID=138064 RepID=A0ABR2X889_9PEZI